jgi:hypothetical protein
MKVVFSTKGNILSTVNIPDNQVPTAEKCAKNNGLKEEDIDINFIKDEELNEITEEENIDTIKKLEGKLKAGKKLQTKEERLSDVRAKLETIDSK